MPETASYLLIELALIALILGFGIDPRVLSALRRRSAWYAISALSVFWFLLDQTAVRLQLWSFPDGATLPARILLLPVEEYGLFIIHSFLCLTMLYATKRHT